MTESPSLTEHAPNTITARATQTFGRVQPYFSTINDSSVELYTSNVTLLILLARSEICSSKVA